MVSFRRRRSALRLAQQAQYQPTTNEASSHPPSLPRRWALHSSRCIRGAAASSCSVAAAFAPPTLSTGFQARSWSSEAQFARRTAAQPSSSNSSSPFSTAILRARHVQLTQHALRERRGGMQQRARASEAAPRPLVALKSQACPWRASARKAHQLRLTSRQRSRVSTGRAKTSDGGEPGEACQY